MLPVSDVEADVHVRMAFPKRAKHIGKDVNTNRGVSGQSKQAAAKPVKLVERMTSHLEVGDDPACVLVEKRAGACEMDAATDFLEERRLHGGRKCLDLMGDGRLAEVKRLGCPREVVVVRHHLEDAELVDRDPGVEARCQR